MYLPLKSIARKFLYNKGASKSSIEKEAGYTTRVSPLLALTYPIVLTVSGHCILKKLM